MSAERIKRFSTESLSVINISSFNMLRRLCGCGGEVLRGDRKLLVYTWCLETLPFYCLGMVNKSSVETNPVFVTFYIRQADLKRAGISLFTECTSKIGHFYTYIHDLKRKFQPPIMFILKLIVILYGGFRNESYFFGLKCSSIWFLYVKHSVSNVDSTSIFRSRIMKKYYVYMS